MPSITRNLGVVIFLVGTLAGLQSASADGLVAWWKAEGNAVDSIGGVTGSPHGGVTYVPGVVGQAFSFNGTDAGISLPDADSLRITKSLGIEMDVKVIAYPTPSQGGAQLFFRGDFRARLDPYFIGLLPDGNLLFHIESLAQAVEITAPIILGQFVHIVASLDDTTGSMRLYENGRVVAQTTTTVRPFADLNPSYYPGEDIGSLAPTPVYGPATQTYHGVIDELKVYNVPLSVPNNVLVDGDFETPDAGTGRLDYVKDDVIGNWVVTDGTVQQVGPFWQAASGKQCLHLNGISPGTVVQNVRTAEGRTYLVSFAMAGNPDSGPPVKQMAVTWGGVSLPVQTFDTDGKTITNMGWSRRAFTVAASSVSPTTLAFQSLTDGAGGPAIDDVIVASVVSGDADYNGRVTLTDALLVLRSVVGTATLDANSAAVADIAPWTGAGGRLHGDGVLDMQDVVALLRVSGGMSP